MKRKILRMRDELSAASDLLKRICIVFGTISNSFIHIMISPHYTSDFDLSQRLSIQFNTSISHQEKPRSQNLRTDNEKSTKSLSNHQSNKNKYIFRSSSALLRYSVPIKHFFNIYLSKSFFYCTFLQYKAFEVI